MTFEVSIPEEWPPGLGIAVAQMVQKSFTKGFPIVVPIRRDATPEQLRDVFEKVRTAIEDAGLAA